VGIASRSAEVVQIAVSADPTRLRLREIEMTRLHVGPPRDLKDFFGTFLLAK
jgi:hypothetical protein